MQLTEIQTVVSKFTAQITDADFISFVVRKILPIVPFAIEDLEDGITVDATIFIFHFTNFVLLYPAEIRKTIFESW